MSGIVINPTPPAPTEAPVTVRDVVDRLYAATQRMSKKNGHRTLMLQAMSALMQVTIQLEQLQPGARSQTLSVPDAPRIQLAASVPVRRIQG